MLQPTALGYWLTALVVWALSAWTIVAAIVEVARGRSRPWHPDVIVAILFHGATAVAALYIASLAAATKGGPGA